MQVSKLKRFGVLTIATGLGTGYFPFASGTVGTLVGVAIVLAWNGAAIWLQVAIAVFVTGIGIWASGEANSIFGEADSSYIVVDEIAGMLITMIGIPVTGYWLVWGFLLFRIFDVVKLPPARYFDERVKNGWGVVMDDVISGIYANILLQLMARASL